LRKRFFLLLILIIVALCPVYACAQQNSATSQGKDAAEEALRDKAYALLETLAGQLNTMQSPENRARIGSNIAWSLWPHNEARARELLTMVQQDINTGLQVTDPEDMEDVHTLLIFLRLRIDTINRIARYDPEFAYDFFKATALPPDLKLSDEAKAGEQTLEVELAKQVAASSPELALQLARKVLARGFSDDLRRIVKQLNRKHKPQAAALYKDIVQKLGEVDLAKDWNGRQFAMSFASSFEPREVDEASFTELVNLFLKAAVANGCNRKMDDEDERTNICNALGPAVALIEKVNPSRAAQLERWKSSGYYYYQSSPYSELEETATESTIEDVLALANKYPQLTDDIRWRAFRKALSDSDLEAAQKIATTSNVPPEQQENMLAELRAAKEQMTVNEERLADVQKELNEIKGTQQQFIFLVSAADQIGDRDHKAAIKLLNQASRVVDTMKPGRDQITSQMGLAMVYCYQKSDRGLAIMESLVPKLNELVEASAKLDGLEMRYLRNGEWNMTGEGTLGEILTGLAQNAGYFARCDFDRAVNLASQFDRTEIRIMAQLKLAQGVLAGPSKRLFTGYAVSYH
jgi:hypothetical protein